jgi:hypothetical protein
MNEYIFYTTEGHTIAPNENIAVENCQVLGFSKGENPSKAMQNLLNENSWIIDAGFNLSKCFYKQII